MADRRDEPDPAAEPSLDALSKRLGTLEQSLTVVAAEIGVSGFPTFRHLDPQQVYDEAVRQARAQILALEGRLQGAVEGLSLRLDEAERRHAAAGAQTGGQIGQLERRLQAATIRLQDSTGGLARGGERALLERLSKLEQALATVDTRIDIVWSQLEAPTRSDTQIGEQRQGRSGESPAPSPALERARALENRLAAQEQSLAQLRDQLAGISAYLQRLGGAANRPLAVAEKPAFDVDALREEILAKLRQWLEDRPASDPLPLLAGPDMPNPLVMGATERAIVRLTHRIERMEEWRDSLIDENERRGRSLKGRLFEG